jgi:hypothetical protein
VPSRRWKKCPWTAVNCRDKHGVAELPPFRSLRSHPGMLPALNRPSESLNLDSRSPHRPGMVMPCQPPSDSQSKGASYLTATRTAG